MWGRAALGATITALALAAAPSASALDTEVESFDGTDIVTHFYKADGLERGERAPTILIGHGWGGTGEARDGAPAPFLDAGYNVLTWDARGFGQSGGTVMIDHPRFEERDVEALIDFVADRPWARLDGPNDPRVGMSGPSYGGGIQLLTAAKDHRVDAITPTIPWHNLLQSLYPRTSVKAGWDLALVGLGIPTSVALGVFNPDGIETGHQSEHFYNSVIGGLSTGMLPEAEIPWFEEHGPDFLLKRIKAPTMISQGTVDTLFDLTQGHRNYATLQRETDVPLKMMWFCGGHGVCNVGSDGGGVDDSALVQERRLAWFDRYLRGNRSADVGPAFEWIDQNGKWHRSGAYPLEKTGELTGSSESGTVPLVPGTNPGPGVLVAAQPDPAAPIKVPIAAEGGEHVVGAPRVSFTYSATAAPTTRTDGQTHVFGQIVDKDARRRRRQPGHPDPDRARWLRARGLDQPDPHRQQGDGVGLRASDRRPVEPLRRPARRGRGDDLRPRGQPPDHPPALATPTRWWDGRHLGTRPRPLRDHLARQALQPGIDVAQDGFEVDQTFFDQTLENQDYFDDIPSTEEIYLDEDGTPRNVGSTLRNPDMASAYERIAERGADGFYEGTIARATARATQEPPIANDANHVWRPGLLTRADIRDYEALRRKPTEITYRGREIWGMGPPSSGGSTVGEALNILEGYGPREPRRRPPRFSRHPATRSPTATPTWPTRRSSTCRCAGCSRTLRSRAPGADHDQAATGEAERRRPVRQRRPAAPVRAPAPIARALHDPPDGCDATGWWSPTPSRSSRPEATGSWCRMGLC